MYVLWSGSGVGVGGVIWKQRLICGLGSGIRPGVCVGGMDQDWDLDRGRLQHF